MKLVSTCFGLGVAVMMVSCSCSVPTGTGNGNENQNTNGNENANGNENGSAGANFVVFRDPDSEFTTSDVLDVDREIVRFDEAAGQIIWEQDGTTQDGWDFNGNLLQGGVFTVAFGTEAGQRRAFFTESATATICDISLNAGDIQIVATSTPVPQE